MREMENRIGPVKTETTAKVELDIRKILEQMGLEKERWPEEWKEKEKT